MPMPYQVVKSGTNFQIQGKVNGKWVNGKDMSYETVSEAWSKTIELIKVDYEKRVPLELRKEIADKVVKEYEKVQE